LIDSKSSAFPVLISPTSPSFVSSFGAEIFLAPGVFLTISRNSS